MCLSYTQDRPPYCVTCSRMCVHGCCAGGAYLMLWVGAHVGDGIPGDAVEQSGQLVCCARVLLTRGGCNVVTACISGGVAPC